MKTASARILTTVQPPIVAPTMRPRLGFFVGEDGGARVGVGVLDGEATTVTVRYSSPGTLLAPQLRAAVRVKAVSAQPCWVMEVLEYWNIQR
jgi:hypothetical protein